MANKAAVAVGVGAAAVGGILALTAMTRGKEPPLPPGEFAYVSGITFSQPEGEADYHVQANVDIQNVGEVDAVCTVVLEDRKEDPAGSGWGGWHPFRDNIAHLLSATLQPGEIVTFFGTVWYVSVTHLDNWEVRFIGDPGEIRANIWGQPGP